MDHIDIKITIKPNGDDITAISESLSIAKAINDNIFLDFPYLKYCLTIHSDSNIQDLIEIINQVQHGYKAERALNNTKQK